LVWLHLDLGQHLRYLAIGWVHSSEEELKREEADGLVQDPDQRAVTIEEGAGVETYVDFHFCAS